jgi:Meiotically up-regulated gene 113
MMTKEDILSEIRRTAKENGGAALGRGRFAAETGIRESDWAGRYWARWGDALIEAGFEPNQLTGRTDDREALRRLALQTRRLGRWVTNNELALIRRQDATFPSTGVYERLGPKRELARRLAAYCSENDLADVGEIAMAVLDEEPAMREAPEAVEYGFVYLLRSGRHYKLGRSNAFGRREREIALQLPERASTVHVIKTDDPAGIENYWHRRFADRRRNGEWFELTPADVSVFKRRKFM